MNSLINTDLTSLMDLTRYKGPAAGKATSPLKGATPEKCSKAAIAAFQAAEGVLPSSFPRASISPSILEFPHSSATMAVSEAVFQALERSPSIHSPRASLSPRLSPSTFEFLPIYKRATVVSEDPEEARGPTHLSLETTAEPLRYLEDDVAGPVDIELTERSLAVQEEKEVAPTAAAAAGDAVALAARARRAAAERKRRAAQSAAAAAGNLIALTARKRRNAEEKERKKAIVLAAATGDAAAIETQEKWREAARKYATKVAQIKKSGLEQR